jgi:hypothetical protein
METYRPKVPDFQGFSNECSSIIKVKLNRCEMGLRIAVTGLILSLAVVILPCSAQESPADHARRATNAIRNGELSSGLTALRTAIDVRNQLTGSVVSIKNSDLLDDVLEKHGQLQYERLATDRPELLTHCNADGFDALRKWLVQRFAGAGVDTSVFWDNANSTNFDAGHVGEHTWPFNDRPASIRVAKVYPKGGEAGQPLAFERLWSVVVYELLNVSNAKAFARVEREAYEGTLSRADYVTKMFHLEYRAVQRTQQFYADYYLPFANGAGLSSNPEYWFMVEDGWWQGAETFLDRYPFTWTYPWGIYGQYFDTIRQRQGALPRTSRPLEFLDPPDSPGKQ